jgi:hypothetical protein
VLGAVIGHQVGGGDGKKIATAAGAVGGAVIGHQVEKDRSRTLVGYRIEVRMDDGSTRTQPQTSARFPPPAAACCAGLHRDVVAVHGAAEKPHCGLRHSWSSGAYFAASSMRRLSASLLSIWPNLVVTRPSTTILPLLEEAQRAEVAGAVVVVLQEEGVEVHLRQQRLGHRLVVAGRRVRALEVAAAQVHGQRHAGRLVRHHLVDELA